MDFYLSFQRFFKQYCNFLTRDVFLSLVNIDKECYGRHIDILDQIIQVFRVLIAIKGEAAEDQISRQNTVDGLKTLIEEFSRCSTNQEIINQYKCHEITSISEQDFRKMLDKMINSNSMVIYNEFFIARDYFLNFITKDTIEHNEGKIQEKFTKHTKHPVLSQAILEFANALAHMTTCVKKNDDDILKNIEKAWVHIYRGTIDHYKMMIRFRNLDTDEQKILAHIRLKELETIGEDVLGKITDRDSILSLYKNFVTKKFKIK